MRALACLLCLFLSLPALSVMARAADESALPAPGPGTLSAGRASESPAWFAVDRLNDGLTGPSGYRSPRALLRALRGGVAAGDLDRAARALDLSALPPAEQAARGRTLAENLVHIMDRRLWIDGADLSARPDGAETSSVVGGQAGASAPAARRSVELGTLGVDDVAPVTLRLERVRPPDHAPVWVVSADVVDCLPALYDAYGPGWVERRLPAAFTDYRLGSVALWRWVALVVLLGASVAAGWMVQKATLPLIHRIRGSWTHRAVSLLRVPVGVAVSAIVFLTAHRWLLAISGPVGHILTPLAVLTAIVSGAWGGLRILNLLLDLARHRYFSEDITEDSQEGQSFLTHLSVARRLVAFAVVVVTLGLALSALGLAERLGLSILASAGAASVLLGLAARSTIGNIIAGVQIAVTKPVRIGDLVLFQGDWGYVEDIAYTYLIIRTWDEKRVVVPLRVFLDTPFENWSKNRQNMVMPIYIHCDYRVDVDDVRETFARILRDHPDYDGGIEPQVHLIDSGAETIQLRFLCSSDDPIKAWLMQQELRERMVAYIRTMADGDYLPRQRVLIQNPQVTGGGTDPQAEGEPVPETGPAPKSTS